MPLLYSRYIQVALLFIGLVACQLKTDQQSDNSNQSPASAIVDDDTLATDVAAGEPEASPDNFVLIPGEQAGVVRANSSEADLRQLLGATNVTLADTIWGAEGDFYIGTTLFKGTPNEASIIWKDEKKRRQPETVLIRAEAADLQTKPASQRPGWVTASGLRLGSTLKEVEKVNGKPFTLYGFGWDYGGSVSGWQNGKLQDADGRSYLSVGFSTGALTPAQEKLYEKVMGDREFSSANPNVQQLNPVVQTITISFRR